MRDVSEYAWVHFTAAAYQRHGRLATAVCEGDKLLEEFEKRFGPCPICEGRGHAPGNTEDCPACHGSGNVRPR